MPMITASMHHTRETITRLSRTQYNTFSFGSKLLQLLCGLILIFIGLQGGTALTSVLCLFAGCWLCVNTDVRAKLRASRICESLHGQYPATQYTFKEKEFLLDSDTKNSLAYSRLIRLIEDNQYLYLYISKTSAYMIDKSTVRPNVDVLKELLVRSTGLRWCRPTSLFNFSLRTLRAGKKKRMLVKYR